MIRLLTSLYNEKNDIRNKELIQCLRMNCDHDLIDEIIVLYEGAMNQVPVTNTKVRYRIVHERPTFKMFFEEISRWAADGDISVIANSDIFFDQTLALVNEIKPNECYALSRWEVSGELVQKHGDSQDCFVVRGKIQGVYGGFPIGFLGSDNRICHEFKKAGYSVTNPCLDLKIWHRHTSGIRNYNPLVRDASNTVPPPYHIVHPSHLPKEKMEEQPTGRIKLLHIGLSARQPVENGLEKACRKHFEYKDVNTSHPQVNEVALEIARAWKPDIVFMQIQREDIIKEETVIELKGIGAYVVNFTGDVRSPIPEWFYGIGKYIAATLFTNYTDVHAMRERGYRANFLELGIDPEIYKPHGEAMPTKEVMFAANSYGHLKFPLSVARIEMVNFLKKKMPERFALYGTGWGQGQTNIADGNLMHSQYVEAAHYRGAKIGINFSHFDADRYSSDRLTRIMGSGCFCLCKRFTNCDMRFKDGEHLRYFDTLEELEQLINYYLNPANEEERRTIAFQGCELIHKEYTFENLALNLKSMYEESLKPKIELKVVAYLILHYGKQFLKEAIQAVAPFVSDIFIFYTPRPSHGHGTTMECPEKEEELKAIALAASDKCHWVVGEWGQEGQHRNEIYKFAPDADVIVNFDADEILDMEDLPKSIQYVANGDKRNYGVNGYVNFWHSMDWEVKDFYRPIRFINTKNEWGTQGEVMQRVYHFGYAQNLATIRYKLSCHGHSDEIPSDWLEQKYLAWSPENQISQLHPASQSVWGEAWPVDKTILPDYINAIQL